MQVHLIPHPSTPPNFVRYVNASIVRSRDTLHVTYVVEGPTDRLALPDPIKPYRTDELWRTTCFELFVSTDAEAYLEFNFSPSSQWALYSFDGYRSGMRLAEVDDPPIIHLSDEGYALILPVIIQGHWPTSGSIAISAVIEEIDGTKSYWALTHAPGPPDFHNRDCFIASLPPPPR